MQQQELYRLEPEEIAGQSHYEINHQVNRNLDEIQINDSQVPEAVNLTTENVEMENFANLDPKLNYKQAEALLHKQCKTFVKRQETQKTTSQFLTQQNNYILQKINHEKKTLGLLQLGADKLNTEIQRLDEQTTETIQNERNCFEIVQKMQHHVTDLELKVKNLEEKRNNILAKAKNQKESTKRFMDNSEKERIRLKDLFFATNNPPSNNDNDQLGQENLCLKQQIIEKRSELQKLKALYLLKVEKEDLESGLMEKKNKYNDIKQNLEILDNIQEHTVHQLIGECEKQIKLRVDDLNSELKRINQKISEVRVSNLDEEIRVKQVSISDIEEKIAKRKEEINEKQNQIDKLKEVHKNKVADKQKQISDAEKEADIVEKSVHEKMEVSESLIKTYNAKREEKDQLLNKKFTLQEKINVDQVLLVEVKLLKEQIAAKENAVEALTDAINHICDEKSIIDMERKKSYLEACKTFLEERVENTKKKRDEESMNMQKLKAIIDELRIKCEEKKEEIFKKTGKRVTPQKGILKDKSKTTPTSPKRVTFINVSSESTVSTQEKEDVFDKIITQLKRRVHPKTDAALNKRKRLVLEDDE